MALEKSLWQRVRKGGIALRSLGHGVGMERIENAAGEGTPDVDWCLDGINGWFELKSERRPARPTTAIRPKVRQAQEIWLRERAEAGCRHSFVLLQVGEAAEARLYLIPGNEYANITATEAELEGMSIADPTWPMTKILLRARQGW